MHVKLGLPAWLNAARASSEIAAASSRTSSASKLLPMFTGCGNAELGVELTGGARKMLPAPRNNGNCDQLSKQYCTEFQCKADQRSREPLTGDGTTVHPSQTLLGWDVSWQLDVRAVEIGTVHIQLGDQLNWG